MRGLRLGEWKRKRRHYQSDGGTESNCSHGPISASTGPSSAFCSCSCSSARLGSARLGSVQLGSPSIAGGGLAAGEIFHLWPAKPNPMKSKGIHLYVEINAPWVMLPPLFYPPQPYCQPRPQPNRPVNKKSSWPATGGRKVRKWTFLPSDKQRPSFRFLTEVSIPPKYFLEIYQFPGVVVVIPLAMCCFCASHDVCCKAGNATEHGFANVGKFTYDEIASLFSEGFPLFCMATGWG